MGVSDFASVETLGPVALLAIAIVFIWRAWMTDRSALITAHERLQELAVAQTKSDESVRALLQALLDEIRRGK